MATSRLLLICYASEFQCIYYLEISKGLNMQVQDASATLRVKEITFVVATVLCSSAIQYNKVQ